MPETFTTAADAPDLSEVRAVFFDLDDTLCAYWNASKAGLRRAFERCGPKDVPIETMARHWAEAFVDFAPTLKRDGWYQRYLTNAEPTRTEQMRLGLLRAGIDDPAMARSLGEAYMEERDRALRLFDDAIEVLEALSAVYPLGLITNGPADVQRQEIETLGIGKYITHALIEGEMGEGKPLPSVFRRAESLVGLAPHQILFVGNSYKHDIEPAIKAGWRTVWTVRPSDLPPLATETEQRPAGGPLPDAIVGELKPIVEWVLGRPA